MSTCQNLRSCSPLKTVLGRLGDTYQAYCNTYKTHSMATPHGGSGQPFDRVTDMPREEQPVIDTNVDLQQDFYPEDTDQFENIEHNNPNRLHVITRELDLHQRIQAEEGSPVESLHHIEQELQQLSISLNLPIHTKPLGEVLKHYTNTLCSAQKQTNITNSLLQDISNLHRTLYHTARRLVSRHRNWSWSNNRK